MKKLYTLAITIFIVQSLWADAAFFLKINTFGKYTVSLNNQVITSPKNIFRFYDITPGNHLLRVTENGFNGRVVYNKMINIQNGYRTVAELDRYFGLQIITKLPTTPVNWYLDQVAGGFYPNTPNNNYPPANTPGCNHPWHPQGNQCPDNFPSPSYPNYPYPYNNNGGYPYGNNGNNNYPYNNNPYSNNPYTNNNGYYSKMSASDMQSLISTMRNVTFEDKMIDVVRTALKERMVETQQVRQLLKEFTFEQNKLEVAKFCYDKTTDKSNYYTLYNDFTFSSYSAQLEKYINGK